MKRFFEKLQYVKVKDILSVFPMLLAIPYALILKKKRPHIWLICENGSEARDNGYWLYRYICRERPETDVVYVIDRSSPDYRKIERLHREHIIPHGIKHWAYYLAAENNISSQKDGKPNAAVCYFFEVYGIWKNRRVFLQHGITHNDVEFLHYKNTKMSLFVCGAKPEYEFVKRYFGYPNGAVQYLGLARFDGLQHFQKERTILVMPTWRKFIATPGNLSKRWDTPEMFVHTKYFNAWEKFFTDTDLNELLWKNGYQIIFFPHRNMQRFLTFFQTKNTCIKIANWKKNDIQNLLKKAAFLITDYSSIAMDFAYMGKPLLYYQFDLDDFRKYQYAEGYFDYERDGFGPVCYSFQDVKKKLSEYVKNNFNNIEPFTERASTFFELHDGNNCRRNFDAIRRSSCLAE